MKHPTRRTENELKADCIVWNHEHPIGSRVLYRPVIGEKEGRETVTISIAYVLSGHTAVVHIEGQAGCVALDAIEAIQ